MTKCERAEKDIRHQTWMIEDLKASGQANRVHLVDQASHAIGVSVCQGNYHRHPIAVACNNGSTKWFAAAIASTPVPVPTSRIRCGGAPDNLIKLQEAAARHSVVARSECEN
jgi:hypothetical protein